MSTAEQLLTCAPGHNEPGAIFNTECYQGALLGAERDVTATYNITRQQAQ